MTMVNGQVVVENRKLVHADMQALIDQVNQAAPALFKRRDRWLSEQGTAVNELQRL